jgi:hypothetical protein
MPSSGQDRLFVFNISFDVGTNFMFNVANNILCNNGILGNFRNDGDDWLDFMHSGTLEHNRSMRSRYMV